ncbi:MAG: D-alanyl-D-alanine carboxypeptidase family protein [Bacillota bacterium]|nr:D-alanyl-D-alanine carboxypeptidase family protein [Bacillota bacterium]
MRKIIFFAVCALLLCAAPPAAAAADIPQFDAQSALLLDGASGQVLFEQNADAKCYPASVTKIMTLALILEAVNSGAISKDDTVSVSEEAAAMGGSQVYLYPGEVRSVDEMLIAIAVGSGNDASYAMAEFIGGTMAGFVQMMNDKAAELGMNDTHFVNPHGLHDDEHYTTAADLGKLAYYAVHLDGFLDYTSIYEYQFRPEPKPLVLWNTNRLLKWYEGTDGLKTGYTEEAGRNLVATAEREGMRLISVILGCQQRQGHFTESMELLNYGFNSFEYYPLFTAGEVVATVPVEKGVADHVNLYVRDAIGYTAARGEQAELTHNVEPLPRLTAPLAAEQEAGTLTVYKDGAELLSAALYIANDVPRGGVFRLWFKLLRHMW